MKIKIIFISINYFTMLWTGANEVFSPRIFISKKTVTNKKLVFTNVPLRYISASVMIKKGLSQ